MRSRSVLVTAALTLGCGAAVASPSSGIDHVARSRRALVEQLCAPLPRRAFDCIVGWPASVPPERRDAVATASGGQAWASAPGVRAFASCSDRPAEDGPVAHVITLLVDTSLGTPRQIAERLPVRVRWTEACEGEADGCASYLARVEGERVVLTRRVQRPMGTEDDVAQLACAAVADGAEEARVVLDGYGALVRALELDDSGVTTIRRRPARGDTERSHRTWTELELGALDERIERESDLRAAAMGRAIDPERVDVANETALDLQVQARQRRVARDPTPDGYRALARLAARGFEAHPSRPDLGSLAVRSYLLAGAPDDARPILGALEETLGPDDAGSRALGVALESVAGDAVALARRLGASAPDLGADDRRRVADALVAHVATNPVGPDTDLDRTTRALIATVRAPHVALAHRARVTLTPARGAVWAIAAAAGGAPTELVVACSDARLPTALGARPTSHGGVMAFAALDHCAAIVLPAPARLEAGAVASGLLDVAAGSARLLVEIGGALVGVGGQLREGGLRVDTASRALGDGDLARAQREVVQPLDALGTRVFPPPTLLLPIPEVRRGAALAALLDVDGVDCRASAEGVRCALRSYESVEQLAVAAFAAFSGQP